MSKALFEAKYCQEILEKSRGSLVLEEENDNNLVPEELDEENQKIEEQGEK